MLSFKPPFSLSSFTLIRRLLSFCSLSAIRVVSPEYLRLLIFLPAILIPACASSSLAFHIMYSAYKLNKQDNNIQPSVTQLCLTLCNPMDCKKKKTKNKKQKTNNNNNKKTFLYNSSVYSWHLFLISSASVRSITFLSFFVHVFA